MANILENRVDAKLDDKNLDSMFAIISKIKEIIPMANSLTLSDDERLTYNSIDVDNKAFVEDTINVLSQTDTKFIPDYVKQSMIQNDLDLFEQMDKIHLRLTDILTRVEEIRRIAASEAINASNVVYRLSQMGAEVGIPGAKTAYEKLKVRYKDSSAGAKPKSVE